MMAERNGWSSYGDKEYVSHVLRYYVFGRIPTGTGSQAIVQVALTQEGNGEIPTGAGMDFPAERNGVPAL